MKFKSPTATPVYLALTSGHSAVVGPEYRDLPAVLHRIALQEGCVTDNMSKETVDAKHNPGTGSKGNKELLIKTIKGMMDNPAKDDFTGAGLPNLKSLSKKAGWNVTREEMTEAVKAIAEEPDVEGDEADGTGGTEDGADGAGSDPEKKAE